MLFKNAFFSIAPIDTSNDDFKSPKSYLKETTNASLGALLGGASGFAASKLMTNFAPKKYATPISFASKFLPALGAAIGYTQSKRKSQENAHIRPNTTAQELASGAALTLTPYATTKALKKIMPNSLEAGELILSSPETRKYIFHPHPTFRKALAAISTKYLAGALSALTADYLVSRYLQSHPKNLR